MGRLMGKLLAGFVYLCIATMMAEAGGILYLQATGMLDGQKVNQIVSILQGTASPAPTQPSEEKPPEEDQEQTSYEERDEARELRARHLEMREQALKSALQLVRSEKDALSKDKERYEWLQGAFEKRLTELEQKAVSEGQENLRQIWENIKPKQAKEQILQMLENDEINEVVTIFSALPISKRAKIVGEFKTADEAKKLDEILRLIRQGVPQVNLIEKTRDQVQQP